MKGACRRLIDSSFVGQGEPVGYGIYKLYNSSYVACNIYGSLGYFRLGRKCLSLGIYHQSVGVKDSFTSI